MPGRSCRAVPGVATFVGGGGAPIPHVAQHICNLSGGVYRESFEISFSPFASWRDSRRSRGKIELAGRETRHGRHQVIDQVNAVARLCSRKTPISRRNPSHALPRSGGQGPSSRLIMMLLVDWEVFPFAWRVRWKLRGYVGNLSRKHRLVLGGWSPGKDFRVPILSKKRFHVLQDSIVFLDVDGNVAKFILSAAKHHNKSAHRHTGSSSWERTIHKIPKLLCDGLAPCADV